MPNHYTSVLAMDYTHYLNFLTHLIGTYHIHQYYSLKFIYFSGFVLLTSASYSLPRSSHSLQWPSILHSNPTISEYSKQSLSKAKAPCLPDRPRSEPNPPHLTPLIISMYQLYLTN